MLHEFIVKIWFSFVLLSFSSFYINANDVNNTNYPIANDKEIGLRTAKTIAPLPKIYLHKKEIIELTDSQNAQVTTASKSQETIFIENSNTALPIYQSSKAVLFYLFISTLTIIAIVKSFFSGFLLSIKESLFNTNLAQQHYRSQKPSWVNATMLTTFFNILTLSTLFYLISSHFSIIQLVEPLPLFLVIFIVISLYHTFKFLANGLLANIFEFRNSVGFYNYNFFVTEAGVCIIILPLLILATFNNFININIILTVALLFVLSGLIFAAFKGIQSTFSLILPHKFYFFLYFCILEIGPFVFVYKFINNWMIIS